MYWPLVLSIPYVGYHKRTMISQQFTKKGANKPDTVPNLIAALNGARNERQTQQIIYLFLRLTRFTVEV